ncbi:hypothetical protein M3Y99_00472500 [Aphelenchoides fujianensis]|nr:hypothetical protein M3Y99_00472500 [Aphelenchoides fujianensis]
MRVFLALLVLAGTAAAWPLLQPEHKEGRHAATNGGATEANFTQKLCHFNPSVKDTWNQRYWQNDDFFKSGGPQFLNLGINDEEHPNVISDPNSPLVIWGKQLNARLFNLETRFFGTSQPTADLSLDSLKFLNGRQAVEDVTDFINAKNKELGITGPWVLFGSAYGGNLVLWHRQLHPDLTVGGHASSAPIEPIFDFYDLTQGVEAAYRQYNSTCADNILAGFKSLHAHMDNADARDELQAAFNFDPAISTLELTWQRTQNIIHVIIGHFLVPVQFNKINAAPWNNGSGIAEICAIMNKQALNPVVPIANVVAYLQQTVFHSTSGTVNINYDMVMYLFGLTNWSNFLATRRAQIWQQCSEYGQMPTTGYRGAFGTDVPVNYFYGICHDVFGADFTADYIQGRMQETKDAFGGASGFNGTNVISVFGSIDPQRSAGLQTSNDPSVHVIVIDGTAQGADLLPANDTTDPQTLKDFRNLAFKYILVWLGNGNNVEQAEKKEEVPVERRASEFESTICWNCGKPKNKIEGKKPSPAEVKKFGNRLFGGRHSTGGFLRNDRLPEMLKGKTKKMDAVASYITQPVDHFNSKDKRTFDQVPSLYSFINAPGLH